MSHTSLGYDVSDSSIKMVLNTIVAQQQQRIRELETLLKQAQNELTKLRGASKGNHSHIATKAQASPTSLSTSQTARAATEAAPLPAKKSSVKASNTPVAAVAHSSPVIPPLKVTNAMSKTNNNNKVGYSAKQSATPARTSISPSPATTPAPPASTTHNCPTPTAPVSTSPPATPVPTVSSSPPAAVALPKPVATISKQQQRKKKLKKSRPEPEPGTTRYWTNSEHEKFLQACQIFGAKNYAAISDYVKSRSAKQVRTHAQKYEKKLYREAMRGMQRDNLTSASATERSRNSVDSTAKVETNHMKTDRSQPKPKFDLGDVISVTSPATTAKVRKSSSPECIQKLDLDQDMMSYDCESTQDEQCLPMEDDEKALTNYFDKIKDTTDDVLEDHSYLFSQSSGDFMVVPEFYENYILYPTNQSESF